MGAIKGIRPRENNVERVNYTNHNFHSHAHVTYIVYNIIYDHTLYPVSVLTEVDVENNGDLGGLFQILIV